LSNSRDSEVLPGTFAVSEGAVTGWDLTSATCSDGSPVTAIVVSPAETVTCTFVNTKRASITIVKDAIPNDPQDFGFTSTSNQTTTIGSFSLDDDADPTLPNSQTFNNLKAGNYSVTESAVAGWDLTGLQCSAGGTPSGATANIVLPAGGSVTCTFTNTKRARLVVVKRIINDNGGTASVGAFALASTAGTLSFGVGAPDGTNTTRFEASPILNLLPNMAYSLHEGTVGGYTNGTWGCLGGTGAVNSDSANGSVFLNPGDNVICTITNNDQPGTIIVRKITDPLNSPTLFSFVASGTGYNTFQISGVGNTTPPQNVNSQTLNAGNYGVAETPVPDGWIPTGVACQLTVSGSGASTTSSTDSPPTATIHLGIGDTVTCTFENTGNLVTRTQGFWATHPDIAEVAWFGGVWNGVTFPGVANVPGIGDRLLCTKNIDSLEKLMGGFWAQISQQCDDSRRSRIDKSRMTLLQQLLAAELNASAFGSVPTGGSGMFAQWEAAFCGTDETAINTARGQAATFNESGDSGVFTPGTHANPKMAKSIADDCFWNNTTAFAPFPLIGLKPADGNILEKP